MACATSQNLCPLQWRIIQAKSLRCPPTMYHCRGGPSPALGLARRRLQAPCGASDACRKCFPLRILLADGGRRCHQASTLLRRMSVLCSTNTSPGPGPPNHPHHMAICRMGARHGRASTKGPRRLHPSTGINRQVLQMDRGSSDQSNQIRASGAVLHRHYPQVWDS